MAAALLFIASNSLSALIGPDRALLSLWDGAALQNRVVKRQHLKVRPQRLFAPQAEIKRDTPFGRGKAQRDFALALCCGG